MSDTRVALLFAVAGSLAGVYAVHDMALLKAPAHAWLDMAIAAVLGACAGLALASITLAVFG